MRRSLLFVGVAALALSFVPAHADQPQKKKAPPPAKPATPTQGKAPSKTDLEKLLKATDAIAATVSQLRGLPVTNAIVRSVMSKDEIEKRVLERMADDQTEADVHAEELVYKRLGLLPLDADYKKIAVDLLTEQIAGFYDPAVKQLYIADWIDVDLQRLVMAHEIDHALQDQAFDLLAFMKANKDNGDAQLARQALVEGDGVALMIEFMAGEQMGGKVDPSVIWDSDAAVKMMSEGVAGGSAGEKFDSAPLFLRDTLMFPYLSGLRFIAANRKAEQWTKIDAMFKSPPTSTEQILHPEKYAQNEQPRAVKAPIKLAALGGYTATYTNVVGELMWSVLLRQHGVKDEQAKTAAAGWGGDALVALGPKNAKVAKVDDLVIIDLSRWDTEADATEAFAAAAGALLHVTGATKLDPSGNTYVAAKDASGDLSFVERKGDRILLVVGAPEKAAAKVRAEAWKKWKK